MTRRWLSSGQGAVVVASLLLFTISAVLPVSPAAAAVQDSSERESQKRAQDEKSHKRRTIPVVMVAPGTRSSSNASSRPDADHGQHRTEYLFFVNAHVRRHVVEQTSTQVEAVLIALQRDSTAVDHQLGAFFDAQIHE